MGDFGMCDYTVSGQPAPAGMVRVSFVPADPEADSPPENRIPGEPVVMMERVDHGPGGPASLPRSAPPVVDLSRYGFAFDYLRQRRPAPVPACVQTPSGVVDHHGEHHTSPEPRTRAPIDDDQSSTPAPAYTNVDGVTGDQLGYHVKAALEAGAVDIALPAAVVDGWGDPKPGVSPFLDAADTPPDAERDRAAWFGWLWSALRRRLTP